MHKPEIAISLMVVGYLGKDRLIYNKYLQVYGAW